jgi:hypothetical protein
MSERSERVSEARRARGSTLGGFLLERVIVPVTMAGAWIWLLREIEK